MEAPTTAVPNNLHQPTETHEQKQLRLLFMILTELQQLNRRLEPLEKLTKSKMFMRRFSKDADED